jgi:phosphodiesterase/alkaline phosphatase D-like protein
VVEELTASSPEFRVLCEDHQVGRLVRMERCSSTRKSAVLDLEDGGSLGRARLSMTTRLPSHDTAAKCFDAASHASPG